MRHFFARPLFWAVAYILLAGLFTWWSYSLTAPNLILSSWPPYWQWQLWMWRTFFNDRPLLANSYLAIVSAWWLVFAGLLWSLAQQNWQLSWRGSSWGRWLLIAVIMISPLLLANNALSYDVFNYIFNAKMVVVFQANPHVKVALDYAYDDWVRFMHNTHTTAPYGYGWTGLSLVPFTLGMGKFLPTWVLFRLFSLLSWLLWLLAGRWVSKQVWPQYQPPVWTWAALALNPLIVIEMITNSHNDLWMMAPALAGLGGAYVLGKNRSKWPTSRIIGQLVWVALLLAFSISIKLATVVLLPLVLWLCWRPRPWWPLLAAGLLWAPLWTSRSQQFHPWYWSWVLSWGLLLWPLLQSKSTWVKAGTQLLLVIMFSLAVSSLYRYIPYLQMGEYSDTLLLHQKLITWSGLVVAVGGWLGWQLKKRLSQ